MTNDPTKAGANLPVIDMAPLFDRDGTAARTEVARAIQAACRDSGFFYVTGHGVPFVNAYRTLCRSPDCAIRLILEEIGKLGLGESPVR